MSKLDKIIPTVAVGMTIDDNLAVQINCAKDRVKSHMLDRLDELEARIIYNKHDLGELGEFVRTKYVVNFVREERQKVIES